MKIIYVGGPYLEGFSQDPNVTGQFGGSEGRQYGRDFVIDNVVHISVPTAEGKKFKCVYCKMHSVRTKSGWHVDTRLKCSVCDVPLCRGRGCFLQYHQRYHQQIQSALTGVQSGGVK
ncbi:uncharacterized protein LOC110459954 [Mizuhopecten yessoensis]|uniref:PiggyBac transposable element-derived protein 4 C-terminal zinc-finger domain-containing protein n=1 Tax=Mizuhopecten yessoensis TaxID=6573 RepID=A0A210Q3E7_MIZYE|nr:uncharacterized protein LOC110459954 [Mizuhopecten yessoensis]OWF43264.1 hypothetical protein KP79_PYT18786 [Mizuhopecten yessoensis]